MTRRCYITVSIPYVNAEPHLGYALELVEADALARFHRQSGDEVRLLGGTDDHALKNVLAAEAAGVATSVLVDGNAHRFQQLGPDLGVAFDDFIRTSTDPRHRPGVERLWRKTAERGDLYRRRYEGDYCVGCEQFYAPADLVDGRCPEHETPTEWVAEDNWFFRLSRYQADLEDLLADGRLRIEPAAYASEALAFVRAGLDDISVSRSRTRARGWGIPVPDDDGQVVYVWWDALGNYVTALDYGAGDGADAYRYWWLEADERIHVIGKGILRFHAVYWPALLLSAGEPLLTAIFVHPYLTVEGRKISKSAGNGVDPVAVAARYGVDALRWWLLADVPRAADADFTGARLVDRFDDDLANGLGNLASRVTGMLHRFRSGRPPQPLPAAPAVPSEAPVRSEVAAAYDRFDLRGVTLVVRRLVEEANRHIESTTPWVLARRERAGDASAGHELDAVLGAFVATLHDLRWLVEPLLPDVAARLSEALLPGPDGALPPSRPLLPRLGE